MTPFRRFISYYRPYRKLFAADLSCMLAVCLINIAFPQILNLLTKGLFLSERERIMAALPWILAGLVLMYAVRYACFYFVTSWGHIMGARMESDMRRDRGGDDRGREAREHPRLRDVASGRLRHLGRRTRGAALRRTEATDRHRARVP